MTTIPLFPLNTVLYPDGYLPLQIFEVRYLDMMKKCIAGDKPFGVVSLLSGDEVRKPGQQESISMVGCTARVVDWTAPMPGLLQVQCAGLSRFRVHASEQLKHGLWMGEVELIEDDKVIPIPEEQENVANALGKLIRSLQERNTAPAQMPLQPPYRLDECGWVANRWCELLTLQSAEKQRLLVQENPLLRLELIQDVMAENNLLE